MSTSVNLIKKTTTTTNTGTFLNANPSFIITTNHNSINCVQKTVGTFTQTLTIPTGTYTPATLVTQLNTALATFPFNPVGGPFNIQAAFSNGKFTFYGPGPFGAGGFYRLVFGNLLEQLGFYADVILTDSNLSVSGAALGVRIADGSLDMNYGPIKNVSTLEVADSFTVGGISVNPSGTPLTTNFTTNDATIAAASSLTYQLKNITDGLAPSTSTIDVSTTKPAAVSLTTALNSTVSSVQSQLNSVEAGLLAVAGVATVGAITSVANRCLPLAGGTLTGQLNLASVANPIVGNGSGLTNVTENKENFGTNVSGTIVTLGQAGKTLSLNGSQVNVNGIPYRPMELMYNIGTNPSSAAEVRVGDLSVLKPTTINGSSITLNNGGTMNVNGGTINWNGAEFNYFAINSFDSYDARLTSLQDQFTVNNNSGLLEISGVPDGAQTYTGGASAFSGQLGFIHADVKAENVLFGYGLASWSLFNAGATFVTLTTTITRFDGWSGPNVGDYLRGINTLVGEAEDTLMRISTVTLVSGNQYTLVLQRSVTTAVAAATNVPFQLFTGAFSGNTRVISIRGDKQRLSFNTDCDFYGTRLAGPAIDRTFELENNFGTKCTTATTFGSTSTATTLNGSGITIGGAVNMNTNQLQNAQIATSSFVTAPTPSPTASHTLGTCTGFPLTMIVALGAETGIPSASTTSPAASFRAPYAMKLYGVRAAYNGDNDAVAPAAATTIQIRQNATPMTSTSTGTSVLSAANLVIDSGKWSSVTSTLVANNGALASTPVNIADDNIVSIWVTAAPTTGATSLKLTLYYTF